MKLYAQLVAITGLLRGPSPAFLALEPLTPLLQRQGLGRLNLSPSYFAPQRFSLDWRTLPARVRRALAPRR